MNNVYLDSIFLINLLTDYIALLCTAKLCSVKIVRSRIFFASVIGGLYACLCSTFNECWLNHSFIHLSCGMLLCLVSFPSEVILFRCFITLIVVSSVFGGLLTPFVLQDNDSNYLILNSKVLILTFGIVYFILTYFYQQTAKQRSEIYQQAIITLQNNSIELTVLWDSGNELYDPTSSLPILVVERNLLVSLIPELKKLESNSDIFDLFCKLNTSSHLCGRCRLIPCQTLSGKDILLGFIPDKVTIDGKKVEIIIASTNTKLSSRNLYQGIY